ncbi:SIR2 family protein [Solidesulfovibrio sp.]
MGRKVPGRSPWTFRDFHGNEPVLEKLKDTLNNTRKPIAFVGAGASAGLYPLWGRFIEDLADHAVAAGKAEPGDAARWKKDTVSSPQRRVDTIVRKLEEGGYRAFLKTVFGPRRGSDGNCFTPLHAALMRLPFAGYVTSNYDPALDFARAKLRDVLSSGTPTWQDEHEVYDWRTGDVFKPDACPILWLHGFWQRPEGIVLNTGEYAQAYKQGIYRDTLKDIWVREHLAFVGFGFNDPQFTFMVGEFLRDLPSVPPRHIAILGWDMPADGSPPDAAEIKEKRAGLEADYHVRALFYPVQGGDHSGLLVVLDDLLAGCACAVPSPASVPAPAPAAPSWPARWVHETSDDEAFVGRVESMDTLNRWVRDPAVRVVAACAVGGTGKTALVGHWLKQTDGWRSRDFAGLFGWSFYQERDAKVFLRALLAWAHEAFGWPEPESETHRLSEAFRFLGRHAVVLVLDGLEVLQEAGDDAVGSVRHGTFLDADLRELLHGLCEGAGMVSLAVLTSRFTFADMERHLGTAFHQLELSGLEDEQGASLLDRLLVRGSAGDRREVSRRLEGHPLALRVFSQALPETERGLPLAFLEQVFSLGQLPEGSPLSDKVRRLLEFYEKRLPENTVRLLGVVALFRSPVGEDTIVRLARKLFGRKRKHPLPDAGALSRSLAELHQSGILSREPLLEGGHGYACHPILRDHFRSVFVKAGVGQVRTAADLLAGQPAKQRPQSVREIESVLLAIELLLLAGEVKAADDLYKGRLENGKLFQIIPAPREWLACCLGFIRNAEHRKSLERKLSRSRLGFYLNAAGLSSTQCGEFQVGLLFYGDAIQLHREIRSVINESISLQNVAELHIFLGNIRKSVDCSEEALSLVVLKDDSEEYIDCLSYSGWALSVFGRLIEAIEAFSRANALSKRSDQDGDELYSIPGMMWAELYWRTCHVALADRRTRANMRICQRNGWNADIARCHWMLAACALSSGNLDEAEIALQEAEPIIHNGPMLFELARAHLTGGALALAKGETPAALHRAAEALNLAAPRGMKLVHADALVLRGKARLEDVAREPQDRANMALDDAAEARRMAVGCGYPWAERDALRLEIEARTRRADLLAPHEPESAARDRQAAAKAREAAEVLDRRLTLTEADLARADQEAQGWLANWEKEREAAKARADDAPHGA